MFKSLLSKNIGSVIRFGLAAAAGSSATAVLIPTFITPEVVQTLSDHAAAAIITAAGLGVSSLWASIRRNKKIQKLERALTGSGLLPPNL